VIIAPCALCNAVVSSSNKYYFESLTLSSFARHCLTVKFLWNRFEGRLPISYSLAVTSSKLTINWKQSKCYEPGRPIPIVKCNHLRLQNFWKGSLIAPKPKGISTSKGVFCKKANNLGQGLFYYQLSSSICIYICIMHSSRKAYIQLCLSAFAVKYIWN